MSIAAQIQRLGFIISGKLSPMESREQDRRCQY